jgi:glycosyltransferase involved in cell wall biosynthesis
VTPVRLALVAAAPAYYHAPLYRLLANDERVRFKAFFATQEGVRPHDPGFGIPSIVYDVDQLSGFEHEFLARADSNETRRGFWALRDFDVVSRLRRFRPDAVFVHGFSFLTIWLAMAAAAALRAAVLLREDQTLLHGRPWPKRWGRAAVLRALFSQVYGLYPSSNTYDYFRRYGLPPSRLFFVPYCVDNDLLQRRARDLEPERARLRERFGIAGEGPVILYVGKLTPKKQPELLLDAFASVRDSAACALLYVGEGQLGEALRRRVRVDGIADVHFAGFLNQSEIAEAYAAADLFVLPSRVHETFGFVVPEAMNFALPVVVSDKVGSARDLVRDGINGLVFPHADGGALARALAVLVGDAGLRRRLGERSRDVVSRRDYRVAAEGVIAACRAAVGGARA